MTMSNLLWGLGGAIIGAVATYFVMEYIYEKELAELYEDVQVAEEALDEIIDTSKKYLIKIEDAEMYDPGDPSLPNKFHHVVKDEALPNKFHHVVKDEEHADAEEDAVLEAMHAEEEDDDPEEEGEDMLAVDAYNGISLIEVAEVNPGRRIVARFNHDECTLDISSVMSVKTDIFDEVIPENQIEDLLGVEATNILMNAEPMKQERMIAVRNNVINLDFAISY